MYKKNIKIPTSQIESGEHYEGESLEQRMRRATISNEPIKDGAPEIYTERKEGVIPAYNIRTDRWEIAQEAQDYVNRTWIAERDNKIKPLESTTENAEEGK